MLHKRQFSLLQIFGCMTAMALLIGVGAPLGRNAAVAYVGAALCMAMYLLDREGELRRKARPAFYVAYVLFLASFFLPAVRPVVATYSGLEAFWAVLDILADTPTRLKGAGDNAPWSATEHLIHAGAVWGDGLLLAANVSFFLLPLVRRRVLDGASWRLTHLLLACVASVWWVPATLSLGALQIGYWLWCLACTYFVLLLPLRPGHLAFLVFNLLVLLGIVRLGT